MSSLFVFQQQKSGKLQLRKWIKKKMFFVSFRSSVLRNGRRFASGNGQHHNNHFQVPPLSLLLYSVSIHSPYVYGLYMQHTDANNEWNVLSTKKWQRVTIDVLKISCNSCNKNTCPLSRIVQQDIIFHSPAPFFLLFFSIGCLKKKKKETKLFCHLVVHRIHTTSHVYVLPFFCFCFVLAFEKCCLFVTAIADGLPSRSEKKRGGG